MSLNSLLTSLVRRNVRMDSRHSAGVCNARGGIGQWRVNGRIDEGNNGGYCIRGYEFVGVHGCVRERRGCVTLGG